MTDPFLDHHGREWLELWYSEARLVWQCDDFRATIWNWHGTIFQGEAISARFPVAIPREVVEAMFRRWDELTAF